MKMGTEFLKNSLRENINKHFKQDVQATLK